MSRGTFVIIAAAAFICVFNNVMCDDCPSVDDMFCIWKQPVNEDCKRETYIELDDGTKCPACDTCIRQSTLDVELALGLDCPIVACPMVELPENCTSPTSYTLKMDFNGKECDQCDTFVCE